MEKNLLLAANFAFKSYKRANGVISALEAIGLMVDGYSSPLEDTKRCGELYGVMTDSICTIASIFNISVTHIARADEAFEAIERIIQADEMGALVKDYDVDLSDTAVQQLEALAKKYPSKTEEAGEDQLCKKAK